MIHNFQQKILNKEGEVLNLTYYQSLFSEENTEIRCRKVLDEIAPVIKPLFERFINDLGITAGTEYIVRSYDTTLSTTYSDARNPTYADKKKNSDIGRKYFIGLYQKVDEKEYNLFTLELNGMNQAMILHTELTFIPFWAWVKNDKIDQVLNSIPSEYSIMTGWKDKTVLTKDELIPFVKDCIKPRRRPLFQIGNSLPLEGQLDEEVVLEEMKQVWENLREFREFVHEEISISKTAYDVLNSLAVVRDIKETRLLGRVYSVEISALEDHKTNEKRQAIYIYDGEQMITKGFIYYYDFHSKNTPFQTIAVQFEGHNHIFTSSREVLGTGVKGWWIRKLFATQNLDNQVVMKDAMRLLREHDFQVNGSAYFVGSFNNETGAFEEGADTVKKKFIDSALLFAHASKRLELPSDNVIGETDDGSDTDPDGLQPNFQFEAIYQAISTSQFTFSKQITRDLHLNLTALDDKHFVLLSGISGTGKTQICRLYANAVYGLEFESTNPYFSIIPVRPDWTDSSALFGYYSSFEKRYVKTEFLSVLLNALKEREKPHFILLDEMNLARVEYYLSDYLSAVESRKEVPLHQDDLVADIPKRIAIPPNVYLMGTINVDETTHSISDKVLDRAFVMTLSDVDFDSYWDKVDQDIKGTLENEFQMLKKLHRTLSEYDLHFGYRSMKEMIYKLYANTQLQEEHQTEPIDALDHVISEKVLTKIKGDERIAPMLETIKKWLTENLSDDSVSLKHVIRMQEELEYYGAAQFWR